MRGYKVTIFGTVKAVNKFNPADMSVFFTRMHAANQAGRYRAAVKASGLLAAPAIYFSMFAGV